MSTVFTIEGAGWSGLLRFMCRGAVAKGKKVRNVKYPNTYFDGLRYVPAVEAVRRGAQALDDMLTAHFAGRPDADDVLVYAVSMGSQVACKWLRDYGPGTSIPVGRVSFLLLANPEQPFHGIYAADPKLVWFMTLPDYGGVGVPPNTPFAVTDVCRQYDGMADFPNRPAAQVSWLAVCNALVGLVTVHNNYFRVNLESPDNLRVRRGNVSYVLCPTRRRRRQRIEGSYDRSAWSY
ncbi:PE-PPE domain-containing protein [Mycolicibacter sp. MYC123]|uniref:PE-PPE domain-containing protein n=1 Tax=[Mycobacterium] zoologicum TaxID=2872311 RepID=A0ABU5YGD2_9MYCO|nr:MULTISPECIES: PE-PPE domain-containing protein [unclassified Mycolicibacter]MEB3049093.1 PE-PPE domain-containing protein [Mycolicibacter sp. MYC123]MEB3061674.1 PE-PPE domain-containing protein [Mycolicibacter sp. MYC101]